MGTRPSAGVLAMMEQSKFNATLKVVVEPSLNNYYDWNFEPVLFGNNSNQFVKFYTPREAEEANLSKVDQFIKVIVNGYSEGRPAVTKKVENYKDSVKTGEKTVNKVKTPVYSEVTAAMTIYEKVVMSHGSLTLVIRDAVSNVNLRDNEIISESRWSERWATCTGDQRAIPEGTRKLCGTREPNMARNALMVPTKRDLDGKLANTLTGFYRNY